MEENKSTEHRTYRIIRNERTFIVMSSKVAEGYTLMLQSKAGTSFISIDGDNMVDAVRSATLWIKSKQF